MGRLVKNWVPSPGLIDPPSLGLLRQSNPGQEECGSPACSDLWGGRSEPEEGRAVPAAIVLPGLAGFSEV